MVTNNGCLKVMSSSMSSLLCIILVFGFQLHNASCSPSSIVNLTSQEFYNLKDSVDAVIDVRGQSEWDSGHIEGAMLVEALASYGDIENQVTTPMDLAGCEYCDIIVYCRSGNRASVALRILQIAGFQGRLYNGQGVSQWTAANYTLVNDTSSIPAPCTYNDTVSDQCYTRTKSGTVIGLEDKGGEATSSGSWMISGFSGLCLIVGLALSLFV
jgi:rhodanese-related sulfurtransferase